MYNLKNKKTETKNKIEFSKKIFYIIIILFVIIISYSMALAWKTMDTSALAYLIPSITGLTATVVGTYMWKARAENVLKIEKSIGLSNYNELKDNIDEATDIGIDG